jgi:Chaperone of endosialidase/Domain of unknown function (DUF5011)
MLKSFITSVFILLAATFGVFHAGEIATGAERIAAALARPFDIALANPAANTAAAAPSVEAPPIPATTATAAPQTPTSTPPHFSDLSSSQQSGTQQSSLTPTNQIGYQPTPKNLPVQYTILSVPNYITTSALDDQLNALESWVRGYVALATSSTPATTQVPQQVAGGGNFANPFAADQRIDNLSNITVSGVSGLTAADIPSLAYLPITGGTVSGNLTVSGAFTGGNITLSLASTSDLTATNATSTNLFSTLGNFTTAIANTLTASVANIVGLTATNAMFTNASTTLFSAYGPAYFGATATSSFSSTGALTLATPLLVSSGGTGTSTWQTGSIPFFNGTRLTEDNSNLFWDSTNKSLSIGTSTNPNASYQSLFVAKPSYTEIAVSGDGGANYMAMSEDSGGAYLYNTMGNLRMQPFGSFTVEQNNIPQFIVTQGGNVGIGMTPLAGTAAALQIGLLNGIAFSNTNSTIFGNLYYQSAWKYANNGSGAYASFGLDSNTAFQLGYAANNSGGSGAAANPAIGLTMLTNGDVGIGTTSIPATLTVNGTSNAASAINYHPVWVGPQYFNDLGGYTNNSGYNSLNVFTADAASTTQDVTGLLGWLNVSAANTYDAAISSYITDTHLSGTQGTVVGADNEMFISAAGDTGDATGVYSRIDKANSGRLTDAYEFYADTPNYTGGNLTNAYGLYVDIGTVASTSYAIYTNGTTQSYFGGNVGIGTTTPPDLLSLQSPQPNLSLNWTNSGSYGTIIGRENGNQIGAIQFIGSGYGTINRRNAIELFNFSAGPVIFYTNAAERMRIDSTGYVGIGTTTPGSSLTVQGSGVGFVSIGEYAGDTSYGAISLSGLNAGGTYNFLSHQSGGDQGDLYINRQTGGAIHFKEGGGADQMTISTGGKIGIGTTSPAYKLVVDNSGSSGVVAGFENSSGECTINPTSSSVNCSSDITLKKNINPIDATSALASVLALNPVFFNWNAEATGTPQHSGFIAQQVQPLFPDLVSQADNGTLLLNYAGLTPYLTAALQQIASISGAFRDNLIAWLGDANNGIQNLFAKNIYATNITTNLLTANEVDAGQLCATDASGKICITKAQLSAILAGQGAGQGSASGGSGASATSTPGTPPVIQINGANPATITIGDTYNDLGATITGPAADLNLGIATYLNGTLVPSITIDTSQAATDTIDYVAIDMAGLTSTSTRTVIIEPPTTATATSTSTPGP